MKIYFIYLSFNLLLFHSREVNTKINNLHFRALRIVYLDETSSFKDLLRKDGSVTIHHRNLQFLAIEMFKVTQDLAPSFMKEIFTYNEQSRNTRLNSTFYNTVNPKKVNTGLETLRNLGPKIWNMLPDEFKKITSFSEFKSKIKKWIPLKCPCRICKVFVPQLGYL